MQASTELRNSEPKPSLRSSYQSKASARSPSASGRSVTWRFTYAQATEREPSANRDRHRDSAGILRGADPIRCAAYQRSESPRATRQYYPKRLQPTGSAPLDSVVRSRQEKHSAFNCKDSIRPSGLAIHFGILGSCGYSLRVIMRLDVPLPFRNRFDWRQLILMFFLPGGI
jgi:hypothetical protein